MLKVKDLRKKYDDKLILNHLNLDIANGEIYGIVGTNGVGKTTLLKGIAGYTGVDEGTIYIDEVKQTKKTYSKGVGFVPDTPSLYEYLTGEEYLLFAAAMFEIPASKKKETILGLLETLNLRHAKDNLISNYSNGMKQKVSIASAILKNPTLLLLDEPLTGIDLLTSQQIREYLKYFSIQNTVVLTTHLLELAHTLCTKIGILHDGKIVEEFVPMEMSLEKIEAKINDVYLENLNQEDLKNA